MQRSLDEIIAVCADTGWDYLTVASQHDSPEEEGTGDGSCLGTGKAAQLPTEDDINQKMQRIATEDASDDLLGNIELGLASQALEAAIIQMTLAAQGNRKEIIPLEVHIEILQRFISRGEEWSKLGKGKKYWALAECTNYCLASSYDLFRTSLLGIGESKARTAKIWQQLDQVDLQHFPRFLSSEEWAAWVHKAEGIRDRLLVMKNYRTIWMNPVTAILLHGFIEHGNDQSLYDTTIISELLEVIGQEPALVQKSRIGREIQSPDIHNLPSNGRTVPPKVTAAVHDLKARHLEWQDCRERVQKWWDDLDGGKQKGLRAFVRGRRNADALEATTYVRFVHLLITTSRTVLLLCVARLSAILAVAPWSDHFNEKYYSSLRLRSLDAVREACGIWHLLMEQRDTVGRWAILAGPLAAENDTAIDAPGDLEVRIQESMDIPQDGNTGPNDILGEGSGPLDDYYTRPSIRGVRNSLRLTPEAKVIFDDCFSIDRWQRIQHHTTGSIERLRKRQNGKPLRLVVVRDKPGKVMTKGQAQIYAVKVLKSLVQEFTDRKEASMSLKKLVDRVKENEIPAWWPSGPGEDGTVPGLDVQIDAHCEATLCAHWVSLQNPGTRKIPLFGANRPLCATCALYIRYSLAPFNIDQAIFDRIVPGYSEAHWTCCMPEKAKTEVVEKVAAELKTKLREYLCDEQVQAFWQSLAADVEAEKPVVEG